MTAQATSGPHIPVLLSEVLSALTPLAGGTFIDGTFGAGGYSKAILAGGAQKLIALDRDPTAIAAGQSLVDAFRGRLELVETCFSDLANVCDTLVDGIVLDIGVSSMQIDRAERGFSFRFDGPLDMRMAMSGQSAADVVNSYDAEPLANLIYEFGEERQSRAIARAIVKERTVEPITTTKRLADIIGKVVWAKPHEIHPATRTFQALRIYVNDELGELKRALEAAEIALKPGGRLVVVTFHSLEDRIVKQFMAERSGKLAGASRHMPQVKAAEPTFSLLYKKAIEASEAESKANPRARSAKLRAAVRTDAMRRAA